MASLALSLEIFRLHMMSLAQNCETYGSDGAMIFRVLVPQRAKDHG